MDSSTPRFQLHYSWCLSDLPGTSCLLCLYFYQTCCSNVCFQSSRFQQFFFQMLTGNSKRRTTGSKQSWITCEASLGNGGAEHLHGLQNERQVIQKRAHRHPEDSSFVCAPPPETHEEEKFNRRRRHWDGGMKAEEVRRRFLTQTACCRTPPALCWCRLSSARGPATGSAERRRPRGTTGRERPESCGTVKEHIKSTAWPFNWPQTTLTSHCDECFYQHNRIIQNRTHRIQDTAFKVFTIWVNQVLKQNILLNKPKTNR